MNTRRCVRDVNSCVYCREMHHDTNHCIVVNLLRCRVNRAKLTHAQILERYRKIACRVVRSLRRFRDHDSNFERKLRRDIARVIVKVKQWHHVRDFTSITKHIAHLKIRRFQRINERLRRALDAIIVKQNETRETLAKTLAKTILKKWHSQFGGPALTSRCARTERHRPEASPESLECLFLKNLKIS